jgi:hypothetical protein
VDDTVTEKESVGLAIYRRALSFPAGLICSLAATREKISRYSTTGLIHISPTGLLVTASATTP